MLPTSVAWQLICYTSWCCACSQDKSQWAATLPAMWCEHESVASVTGLDSANPYVYKYIYVCIYIYLYTHTNIYIHIHICIYCMYIQTHYIWNKTKIVAFKIKAPQLYFMHPSDSNTCCSCTLLCLLIKQLTTCGPRATRCPALT